MAIKSHEIIIRVVSLNVGVNVIGKTRFVTRSWKRFVKVGKFKTKLEKVIRATVYLHLELSNFYSPK